MLRSVSWLLFLTFSGCCTANVNVLPKENNAAQAIATSANESCALQKAQVKAGAYCKKLGKRYVAIKTDSTYRGADPNAKLAVSLLTGQSGSTSEDYRVDLDFKCE
ncbi:MAG: hypothetical protein U0235_06080 [Polyangiaceae bacterium]